MVKAVYKVLALSFMGVMTLTTPACQNSDDKVISYQEEVKLSDGSMIWVDIKRHYSWSGWTPGMGNSGAYLSGAVEISWDTGFPNVGRKSVFFDTDIYLIDKINDEWYVIGYRYPYEGKRKGIDATNCYDVGSLFNQDYMCLAVINEHGEFVKKSLTDVEHIDFLKVNLSQPFDLDDEFQYKNYPRLTWNQKISFTQQRKKPIFTSSYSFTQQEHPR